ncbi:unnamed protein product, partial [Amoebophrya sp. A120]|eukprot:GSA120T00023289001.1
MWSSRQRCGLASWVASIVSFYAFLYLLFSASTEATSEFLQFILLTPTVLVVLIPGILFGYVLLNVRATPNYEDECVLGDGDPLDVRLEEVNELVFFGGNSVKLNDFPTAGARKGNSSGGMTAPTPPATLLPSG